MRPQENYSGFLAVGLGLTLAILASFQVYIWREPARIAADEERHQEAAIAAGEVLYSENCVMCHGQQGEGVDGPALNDSNFLASAADQTIFSLIASGVPGTEMPAWSQEHGGPFTDEEVRQMVAFIRAWEPSAPDRHALAMAGNPVKGLDLYNSTCVVCHGEEGAGTERAPALNDPDRYAGFDDEWFVDTIRSGRPSTGMPTWGTVLSPVEIRDAVALLRAWQQGETVEPMSLEDAVAEAMHMLDHGDLPAAELALQKALQNEGIPGEATSLINEVLQAVEAEDGRAASLAMTKLTRLLDIHGGGHDH